MIEVVECIGCGREIPKAGKDPGACKACLATKSLEVLRLEKKFGLSIDVILSSLIRMYPTWPERYTRLGVSKVTLYAWVRKYLKETPAQAVRRVRGGDTSAWTLQTGSRDYLSDPSIVLLPE